MNENIEFGKVWFNYESVNNLPIIDIDNLAEEHLENLWQGYAATVLPSIDESFNWLVFKNIDDHVDGNGITTLYITKGTGKFYYEDSIIDVKENDIIVFDDNLEHGFSADDICIGLNITWGAYIPNMIEVQNKIENVMPQYRFNSNISQKRMRAF